MGREDMASDAESLKVVLAAQKKQQTDPAMLSTVLVEIKSSVLFQYNWQDLLQSGPTAIYCMGACIAASSSSNTAITLTPPQKGFKVLQYTTVQANLVETANLGGKAFLAANDAMDFVHQSSKSIAQNVNDAVESIKDPRSAHTLLPVYLDSIKKSAAKCLEKSLAMDKNFEAWLDYACELHAACVQEETTVSDQVLSAQACIAATEVKLGAAKDTVKIAKETNDKMKQQADVASDAFKKASDNFPSGWEIIGQQIVGDLANCATNALNAVIPALVAKLDPMSPFKEGADIIGDFVHPPKGSVPPEGKSKETNTSIPKPPPPTTVPKASQDPAMAEIVKDMTFITSLHTLVIDKNGNVDWEGARGAASGAARPPSSGAQFLSIVLSDALENFGGAADPSSETSQEVRAILHDCAQIASELEGEVSKAHAGSYKWPSKSSQLVKKWQTTLQPHYEKATSLYGVASSTAGSAAGAIPPFAQANPVDQANAHTAQAQVLLKSATDRLDTTQKHLENTQKSYLKATEMLLKQTTRLGAIQADLLKLSKSTAKLADVKRVLIQCIKLILTLKQQIANLVLFFNAMPTFLEVCIDNQVTPFLKIVEAITTTGKDPHADTKIGVYTLTDMERSKTVNAAITIRAYFDVFGSIAKMWLDLSINDIIPGLQICQECGVLAGSGGESSTTNQQQLAAKVQQLQTWSTTASADVKKIADKEQKSLTDGMQSRIATIATTTATIPAPPPEQQKAITSGTAVNHDATNNYLETKSADAPYEGMSLPPAE